MEISPIEIFSISTYTKRLQSKIHRSFEPAALKHGIRNPESGTRKRKPKRNHGIMETETETEYGICERRFQAIDLKEKYYQ